MKPMKTAAGLFACVVGIAASSPVAAQTAPQTASSQPAAPAASSAPAPASAPPSTIVERVLVRVNGEIFTQSQLTNRQIDALRASDRPQDANLESAIAEITPELLVAAVDELLIVQHGRELGLVFSAEQFKTAIDNIKTQNKLDDKALEAALAQDGYTMESLRQRLEQQYLIQGVQQREIGPSMTITLEEQRQYYKRNADRFMTPLTVTVRELVVNVPTRSQAGQDVFSAADDAAAKAKLEDLRAKAVAGEDFVALVAANSDSPTKANGGLIGPVQVDDLSEALKDHLAALKPGEYSELLRTPRGYQLLKLEERSAPQLRPFDDVRREIESAIRNERLEPEMKKMIARLRTQAVIEWKDDALKQIYEKHIAEEASAIQ